MSKKAMISQPMRGRTDVEIQETRQRIRKVAERMGYEVIDTWFRDEFAKDESKNKSIYMMALSLKAMSECDAVFFADGYEEAEECLIEERVAEEYGLDLYYIVFKMEDRTCIEGCLKMEAADE